MATVREKFSSQAPPDLLAGMREVARKEGRQFQAVLEDAMRYYLENQTQQQVRPEVMATSRPAWRSTGFSVNCSLNEAQLSDH